MKITIKRFLFGVLLLSIVSLFAFVTIVKPGRVPLIQGPVAWLIVDTMPLSDFSDGSKVVNNNNSRYSIKYPVNWQAHRNFNQAGMTLINGGDNTPSYNSIVNIQTINTKQYGGEHESVSDFMKSVISQIHQHYNDAKMVSVGKVRLQQPDGSNALGEFLVFTFNQNGLFMKQWQIIVRRDDGRVFYTWAYTSPVIQYPRDLKVARMMLDSWRIY